MGGGTASVLAPVLDSTFAAPDNTFGVLRDLLGVLEDRLDIVRNGVERRQALASATPSIWPVAGWLSSPYGIRRDPFTGGADFHPGLDISADHGSPVHAPADGIVASAGSSGTYGNLVSSTTASASPPATGTSPGSPSHPGRPRAPRRRRSAYVGSTGRSTSSHLHYEVLLNGQLTNPLKLLAGR